MERAKRVYRRIVATLLGGASVTVPSSSYQHYKNRILAELKSLTPKQLLAFSIWCASRLIESVDLRTDLLESEVDLLQEIVAEAWPEQVADVRNRVERIGPSDPVAQIEMDPRVIDTLSCVWLALDYYLTRSVEGARSAAECLINVIDYERDHNDPETMLEYPPLRAEFERQLKMIDCLHTATLESMSLEQLRSFERLFG